MPVTHFIKEPKSVDVDDLPESTIKDYLQDRYDLTPTIHESELFLSQTAGLVVPWIDSLQPASMDKTSLSGSPLPPGDPLKGSIETN